MRRQTPGFTLVESTVALVVLGIAIAAILTPITAAIEQKRRAMKQTVATLLAEQAIDEWVAQDRWSYDEWAVLGPSGDEPWRDNYDERSDYHDVEETGGDFGTVFGERLDASEFAPNLRRTLWLQTFHLPGERDFYPWDVMMLTVRVYDGDEELVTLRRILTNEDHPWP